MVQPVPAQRILIVDDDAPMLGQLEAWLDEAGYDVVACTRFDEARQYLASHSPDILLTDVRLGAFNGLQLVLLVKADRPRMRAIVFSDYDDPVLEEEALRCGARFVRTPSTSAALLACVGDGS